MTCMRVINSMAVLAVMCLVRPVWADALLRDGLYLKSLPGRVVAESNDGPWTFQIQNDIKDKDSVVPKQTKLTLLPSGMLEVMLEDGKIQADSDVRIWAKVTLYQGKNYLFLMNYLCLSQPKAASVSEAEKRDRAASENRLQIPEAVLKRMAEQPVVHASGTPKAATILLNKIVINRVGYIDTREDKKVFVFDGLGYTVEGKPVEVLPCETLEGIERIQASGIGPYRFSIAGMTTAFRGREYVYLQRANRVYSHGNFGQ